MALAPEILALTYKIKNTKLRQAAVFIVSTTTSGGNFSAAPVGRVREVSAEFAPVLSEADSFGRQSTMGYDVTATFIMQQTDEERELLAAAHMGYPDDGDDGDLDGFNVMFTNIGASADQARVAWKAAVLGTAPLDGIGFMKALFQVSPNLNFAGGESGITITITGRIPADRLKTFGLSNIIRLV